jgi:hypothetical protein
MKRPAILLGLNATNYLLLVLNYRAVAQGDMLRTLATDLAIAALSFTAIRRIGAASGPAEFVGYVLGGLVGSALALSLSRFLE